MTGLYPLKFEPILKERVWGGNFLQKEFGKQAPDNKKIGESWEISGVQGDISKVCNGFLAGNNLEELVEVYMGDLVGEVVYEKFGKEFPLLIKFIDARQNLSIQVHPDDKLAIERHKAYGKTEMWYVLETGIDTMIYTGFNKDIDPDQFTKSLNNNTLDKLLNADVPKPGDTFFIPAGRVHAIGAGNVVAEIQQTSDITYRIYDWGRVGLDGNSRELHTDLALEAIDYKGSVDSIIRKESANSELNLVECPYFTTNLLRLNGETERDLISLDSFVIYICTEGSFYVKHNNEDIKISRGETILIPASSDRIILNTDSAAILEVYTSFTTE